ncbi:hypothetical protein FD04_GL002185 [Secundilactobacillus odoratitofui DSM 19909 = JCM 15043]|uniref:AP2/ERF domain-containing protein n=1 Tax=Secundilactobacillus odoratitofui DSM 19909 = JCM 15043 TaxID=1423776 RepID=A0A0R1LWK8_9LACO|nr:hypothetical protein FD04_GL002185 [Secundilactobacillus odoratitofui DSM 19909 = JCM 15043]
MRRDRGREVMQTNNKLLAHRGNVSNLRQVEGTSLISVLNRRKNNHSGVAGVSFDTRSKHWVARLMVRGTLVLNHSFVRFDDAVEAREKAVDQYLGPLLAREEKRVNA